MQIPIYNNNSSNSSDDPVKNTIYDAMQFTYDTKGNINIVSPFGTNGAVQKRGAITYTNTAGKKATLLDLHGIITAETNGNTNKIGTLAVFYIPALKTTP